MGSRIVDRPWVVVTADIMEFPPSKSQMKYIIVFQDLFTRWVELKPIKSRRKICGARVRRVRVTRILVLFTFSFGIFLFHARENYAVSINRDDVLLFS